jgi:Mg2+ and Co2+ transporter CorA
MMTRRKPGKALAGKKFLLTENAKSVEGLEDKIKEYEGKIYKTMQKITYVVCLPDELEELREAPDRKKDITVWRAYQAGKTFVDTTSFDSLTHDIESWKPTEFIPPVPTQKTQRKSSVCLERKSSLVLDTISVSNKDAPKDEASGPERFTAPNISKLTLPTKMALEEQASSVSNSTAEGLENIQRKLQYLRTSLDSQMDKLTRLSAENRSWVQALNDIEQVSCDSGYYYLQAQLWQGHHKD